MKYILIFFLFICAVFAKEIPLKQKNINSHKIFSLGHFDSVNEIIKYPKKDLFISIGKDEKIILWNLQKNKINSSLSLNKGSLSHAKISPNGNFLVTSNDQGYLFLINYNTFGLLDAFNYLNSKIIDFYFINNNKILVIYQDKKVIIFDIFKKEKTKEISFEFELTNSSDFNDTIAISDRTGSIFFLNEKNLNIIDSNYKFKNQWITSLKLINDDFFTIGINSKKLLLFNIKKKKTILEKITTSIPTAIFSNKKFTAIGFSDGNTQIFSKYLKTILFTFKAHDDKINSILVNDNMLITGSDDSKIIISDIYTGKILKEFSNK